MPDTATPTPRSAVTGHLTPGTHGSPHAPQAGRLQICEVTGRSIIQVAGWPDTWGAVSPRLAELAGPDGAVLPIAPQASWLVAEDPELAPRTKAAIAADQAAVVDLSHSRTVLRLDGWSTRHVLSKGVTVDMDPRALQAGSVIQTAIHGIGLLLHVHDNRAVSQTEPWGRLTVDLYCFRGFAVEMVDWLLDHAADVGAEVTGAG